MPPFAETPGSDASGTPGAPEVGADRIRRFVLAERLAHWLYAFFFLGALITGLLMWIPATRVLMADDRQGFAQHHGAAGFAMVILPLLLFLILDRRRLAADVREADLWDANDRRWFWAALRGRTLRGGEMPPQGRFNAGQKMNVVLVAVMALGFVVTGSLLLAKVHLPAWLVSRALWLHGFLAIAGTALLVAHLAHVFLTRHGRASLRAIVTGMYPVKIARERHRLWWEKTVGRTDTSGPP